MNRVQSTGACCSPLPLLRYPLLTVTEGGADGGGSGGGGGGGGREGGWMVVVLVAAVVLGLMLGAGTGSIQRGARLGRDELKKPL